MPGGLTLDGLKVPLWPYAYPFLPADEEFGVPGFEPDALFVLALECDAAVPLYADEFEPVSCDDLDRR